MRLPAVLPARLLFLAQMRRVIGGHDVHGSVDEARVHGVGMVWRHVIRQRVRAEPLDVLPVVAEPEAPGVDLRGDRPARGLRRAQHLDDALGLRVEQMQAHAGRFL